MQVRSQIQTGIKVVLMGQLYVSPLYIRINGRYKNYFWNYIILHLVRHELVIATLACILVPRL